MDTSVALIIAKTLSPTLRFIRLTEPVVIIDVTSPAIVLMVSSETTLSETIRSITPGIRFRMLVLMGSRFNHSAARVVKRAEIVDGIMAGSLTIRQSRTQRGQVEKSS